MSIHHWAMGRHSKFIQTRNRSSILSSHTYGPATIPTKWPMASRRTCQLLHDQSNVQKLNRLLELRRHRVRFDIRTEPYVLRNCHNHPCNHDGSHVNTGSDSSSRVGRKDFIGCDDFTGSSCGTSGSVWHFASEHRRGLSNCGILSSLSDHSGFDFTHCQCIFVFNTLHPSL